ncbi:hypothetical protein CIL05_17930 [Virgibacillus profundi]|uniref:DUF2089 domain-containing protein n=1 Tax=Virgibacillus profundi TaxID=2024555 RepID=A0A2A2IA89_9BACI|nr:DUF2089 domain-containing protein [Virgibacillus profundi]PAV28246.1 hypothetical protein CIL05_17930 [Virgibacillus profundi]PXY52551.1 DUF2089 domain-containing protein [Virgibacillus profundi]
MSYSVLNTCPVCEHSLHVTKLQCSHCHTTIENKFELSKLASLSAEQMHFIETFIISRGNIKEVEKELGISYPTVRGKLNEIIEILRPERKNEDSGDFSKAQVIAMLENDEITAKEAVKLLKNK